MTKFPIRLAYALTTYKAQEQALEKVFFGLGKSQLSLGLTFVSPSRVKNYKDFLIQPFNGSFN
jgi:hypothetical protein